MRSRLMHSALAAAATLGLGALLIFPAAFVRATEPAAEEKQEARVSQPEPNATPSEMGAEKEARPPLGRWLVGRYWIGVVFAGAPHAEGATAEEGPNRPEPRMKIIHVVPESPAARAGLQQGDVLLQAGGREVSSPRELVAAVEQSKGEAITIVVRRGADEKSFPVTPAERRAALPMTGEARRWLEQLAGSGEGLRMDVMRPGVILPPDVFVQHALPDDMTVTVTKTGKQPATIKIVQGHTTWEVTEQELDKLPKEVRPHAEAMLGRMTLPLDRVQVMEEPMEAPPAGMRMDLERRMEEMARRMEALMDKVDALRQERAERRAEREAPDAAEHQPFSDKRDAPDEKTPATGNEQPAHPPKPDAQGQEAAVPPAAVSAPLT